MQACIMYYVSVSCMCMRCVYTCARVYVHAYIYSHVHIQKCIWFRPGVRAATTTSSSLATARPAPGENTGSGATPGALTGASTAVSSYPNANPNATGNPNANPNVNPNPNPNPPILYEYVGEDMDKP